MDSQKTTGERIENRFNPIAIKDMDKQTKTIRQMIHELKNN